MPMDTLLPDGTMLLEQLGGAHLLSSWAAMLLAPRACA
jgi:hypothetical protein